MRVAVLDPWLRRRAVLYVQPQRLRGAVHRLPLGRLVYHRCGVLSGWVVSPAVQRRAVLRRPHPQRDLGDASRREWVARFIAAAVVRRLRVGWGGRRPPGGPEDRPWR